VAGAGVAILRLAHRAGITKSTPSTRFVYGLWVCPKMSTSPWLVEASRWKLDSGRSSKRYSFTRRGLPGTTRNRLPCNTKRIPAAATAGTPCRPTSRFAASIAVRDRRGAAAPPAYGTRSHTHHGRTRPIVIVADDRWRGSR
jgi:hypothetical protein